MRYILAAALFLTVLIGGKPASNVVVSVEGLPPDYLKSKISNLKSQRAIVDQRNMKFVPRVLPVVVGTTIEKGDKDGRTKKHL